MIINELYENQLFINYIMKIIFNLMKSIYQLRIKLQNFVSSTMKIAISSVPVHNILKLQRYSSLYV